MNGTNSRLDFPIKGLDMSLFSQDDDSFESCIYDLYSCIVHVHSSNVSGHFISYTWVPDPGVSENGAETAGWFKLDDSAISQVSENFVKGVNPYLLFYMRREETWDSEGSELSRVSSSSPSPPPVERIRKRASPVPVELPRKQASASSSEPARRRESPAPAKLLKIRLSPAPIMIAPIATVTKPPSPVPVKVERKLEIILRREVSDEEDLIDVESLSPEIIDEMLEEKPIMGRKIGRVNGGIPLKSVDLRRRKQR
jgi:hypothetical protein